MPSKVASAYVELNASLDQLTSDMKKGQQLTKDATAKMAAQAKKADTDATKLKKKTGEDQLKDQKSLFARMAANIGAFTKTATPALQSISKAMSTIGLIGAGLVGGFVAFAKASEFPHAKILQRQFEAIRNELYIALIPAIKMLYPIFERLRVIIYQNSDVFRTLGEIAARTLGLMVTAGGKVLGAFNRLPDGVKNTVVEFGPMAAVVGLVGSRLTFLLPIARTLLSVLAGWPGIILAAVGALGGLAGAGAFGDMSGAVNMAKGAFTGLMGVIGRVKEWLMDALVRIWTIVKPAWDTYVATIRGHLNNVVNWWSNVFGTITGFLGSNGGSFEEWGTLLVEIIGNILRVGIEFSTFMFDTIAKIQTWWFEVWSGCLAWFVQVNAQMLETMGVTWEGIKGVVTYVMEFIALVVSNLTLSIKIACVAIALSFSATWDVIKGSFFVMVGAVAGGFAALWAGAQAVWENITALFSRNRSFVSIGSRMGEAFGRTFNSVTSGRLQWSETTMELERELGRMNEELNAGRQRQREQGNEAVAEARAARARAAEGNQAGAPAPVYNIKFETVGFKDMWKKVQESMSGSSMQALAQRQLGCQQDLQLTNRQIADNTAMLARRPERAAPAQVG